MKGAKSKDAALVFEAPPIDDGATEEAGEDDEEGGGKTDTLLGNAYDAFADGDRAGFIASLKAVLRQRE